jgi:mannose-1-phosphate guanylyltransferase
MNALLLAAGFGTRLKGQGGETPKPLLEIGGIPLLDLLISKVLANGVDKIFINAHYKFEKIVDFVAEHKFKDRIQVIIEETPLGTAGTLKANLDKFNNESFLVLHADNFFEDDLIGLFKAHQNSPENTFVTMGTFITENPENCGTLTLNDQLIVTQFIEKDPKSNSRIANSAIYIFKPNSIEQIRKLKPHETDISKNLIPKLVGNILAHPLIGYFIDIGTPETLNKARRIADGAEKS